MDKNFNWRPYIIGISVIIIGVSFFNIKFGICSLMGTVIYFINDQINLRKFPKLDSNSKAILSMLGLLFVQGILTIAGGFASYFIGGIYAVIVCFICEILPTLYFLIIGARK